MCELPTLYSEREVRARKQHRCCECRISIKPGDTYSRVEGLWDGRFQTYKTCTPCAEARDWLSRLMPSDECGPTFGDLHDYLADEWREGGRKMATGRKLVAFQRRNLRALAEHREDQQAYLQIEGNTP